MRLFYLTARDMIYSIIMKSRHYMLYLDRIIPKGD